MIHMLSNIQDNKTNAAGIAIKQPKNPQSEIREALASVQSTSDREQ
jgi:hypothetical protein